MEASESKHLHQGRAGSEEPPHNAGIYPQIRRLSAHLNTGSTEDRRRLYISYTHTHRHTHTHTHSHSLSRTHIHSTLSLSLMHTHTHTHTHTDTHTHTI